MASPPIPLPFIVTIRSLEHEQVLCQLLTRANAKNEVVWGRPDRKHPSLIHHRTLIAGNVAEIAARPQSRCAFALLGIFYFYNELDNIIYNNIIYNNIGISSPDTPSN